MDRVRNWCFTLNNYTETQWGDVTGVAMDEDCKYLVVGKEKGESGTPHLQGYIEFAKPMRMSAVKRYFGCDSMHLEKRRGTPKEASDYCKKDGDFFEHGQLSKKRQGERKDLDGMWQMLKERKSFYEIVDSNPRLLRYSKAMTMGAFLVAQRLSRTFRKLTVTVLWGKGGTGKTRMVYDKHGYDQVFCLTQPSGQQTWWDGYEGQKVLLIDDFYGWLKWGFFLRVLDGHPLRLGIKGAHTWAGYEQVYITSNKHPDSWYEAHSLDDPEFKRRITEVIRMGEPEPAQVDFFNLLGADVIDLSQE